MRSIRYGIGVALIAAMGIAGPAFAQAAAGASPEPGDNPTVEAVKVTPADSAAPDTSDSSIASTTSPTSTPGVLPSPLESSSGVSRLEQRVDDTNTNEAIRVAPKSRKNVTRLDNRPNKPRIKPIAVIHGPVSPWGYANRYINGEVERPAAKELQGNTQQPGQRNAQGGGAQPGQRVQIGGGGRRRRAEE